MHMLPRGRKRRKLNLGCGEFKKEGFINVDIRPETKPEVVWDLNKFPYPFETGEFELIEADHVIEHLNDPFGAMKELHRILKDGGKLIVRVPHFSRGFTHPDHRRGFDLSFPYYFDRRFKAGYMGYDFFLEGQRLRWFGLPRIKKEVVSRSVVGVGILLGDVIDFFANLSPFICSKFWCFWVGGFDEVEFRFVCRKWRRFDAGNV